MLDGVRTLVKGAGAPVQARDLVRALGVQSDDQFRALVRALAVLEVDQKEIRTDRTSTAGWLWAGRQGE
jgi:hypothetical protein